MSAIRIVLLCLLVVSGAAGAVAGTPGGVAGPDATATPEESRLFQQETATPQQNNSSTQHEDPETVDASGDSERVQSYLASALAQRLQGSTANLSQGEYEQARAFLGEEYREDLGKFVEVAGDTEASETAARFETIRDQQQSYINQTQSYRETKAAYREAVENGNETRARELARELAQTSAELNETGTALSAQYTTLENQSGSDLSTERSQLDETTANITADAADVAAAEFTETQLSVRIEAETVSFLDPATLSGRLVTENGTALANRTVTLSVAGRPIAVDTNASGAFSTQYRPTVVSLDQETLPVAYVPGETTVYLGSNASVPVDLRQVTATTDVTGPSTAAFNDTVTVSGRVAAEGNGAADVPVRIRVGGVTLGTAHTNASGVYSLSTTLPANVIDGSQPLTASVALSERALTSPPAETSLRVDSTATTLRLNASIADGDTAQVRGRLKTVDGTAIPGRSVDIRLAGSVVATVDTDAEGRFATTVELPAGLADADEATVEVAFAGTGTNLAASQTTATLLLSGGAERLGLLQTLLAGGPLVLLGGGGLLVVVSAVGVAVLLRRSDDATEAVASSPTATAASPSGGDADDGRSPVASADGHLEAEPSLAVELAFASVRRLFEERYDVAASATHREFARACRRGGLSERRAAALDQLTDVYERAAFGPSAISDQDAREAVDIARTLCD